MRQCKFSVADGLLAAAAVLYLCTFALFNTLGFAEFATADVYADTLYAMEAWDSRSIFPDGWSFGNQYYVVATPVLAALFYGLTGSPNPAMALATASMTVLLLLSLDWLLRPFAAPRQRLAAAVLLMGGMIVPHAVESNEGQLLFVLASYYSCYLIALFVTLGDYLRAVADPRRPLWRGSTVLAAALLFATGMHSLRQTAICVLPLAALEVCRLLLRLLRRQPVRDSLRATARAALYAAANLGGVLFMRALDVPRTGMFAETTWRTTGWGEAAAVNGRILAKLTGFWYVFHEENGWAYLLLAALFCGLLIASLVRSVRAIITSRSVEDHPFFLAQCFFLIGLAGLFALNFFFEMSYFRTMYCFTWYAFTAVSIASLLAPLGRAWRSRALAALAAAGCIGSWAVGWLPDLGRCFAPESPPVYDQIADCLVERGYRYLYGSWYIVPLVALRTDGACRGCAYYGEIFRVLPYINPQDSYGPAENAEAAYLLTAGELPYALAIAAERGAALTEVALFAGGEYGLYESDLPLMRADLSDDAQ